MTVMLCTDRRSPDRFERRLDRQFDAISRQVPQLEKPLRGLRQRSLWVVRVPMSILLIAGGVMSFLPVLGIWMLPAGLMLLAVDVPFLRRPLSAGLVLWRRKLITWRRKWRK